MPEYIKVGDIVMLRGKVTEIIINEKETLYRIKINEVNPPNTFSNDVLVRGSNIVE